MFGRKKEFRRFATGSGGVSIAARQVLWLASDHLLLVNTYYFVEQYRRFFFKDIQSIVIQRTVAWPLWNFVLGLAAALFGMLAWIGRNEDVGFMISSGAAGYFLLALTLNVALGRTCRCRVQTAAGEERLPSIGRLRKARKLVRILRPLIDAAQPPLQADELAAIAAQTPPVLPPPAAPDPASVPEERGRAGSEHWFMFLLLFFFGVFELVTIYYTNVPIAAVETGVFAALILATAAALIRQQKLKPERVVVRMSWITLGLVAVAMAAGYVKLFMMGATNPRLSQNQVEMFMHLARQPAMDDAFTLFSSAFLGVGSLSIGGLGFHALRHGWRRAPEPPPLPPPS